uniref:(northern house mosquito) hypothetical protein n=1 Tax=Culex pipiens TaxID=7175 RepID=A0A8D8GN73_CULPI
MLLGQGGLRSCAEFCLFLIGFSFRFIFKLIYLNGATDLRPFSYYAFSQYFTNLFASPFFTFHSCFLQLSVEAVAGHSCFFFYYGIEGKLCYVQPQRLLPEPVVIVGAGQTWTRVRIAGFFSILIHFETF